MERKVKVFTDFQKEPFILAVPEDFNLAEANQKIAGDILTENGEKFRGVAIGDMYLQAIETKGIFPYEDAE